jgi:hypothetical protein
MRVPLVALVRMRVPVQMSVLVSRKVVVIVPGGVFVVVPWIALVLGRPASARRAHQLTSTSLILSSWPV